MKINSLGETPLNFCLLEVICHNGMEPVSLPVAANFLSKPCPHLILLLSESS